MITKLLCYGLNQSEMVTTNKIYSITPKELYSLALKILKNLQWRIILKDNKNLKIKGRTNGTPWSWGEDVAININQNQRGSMLKISSEPTHQLFDWWKSNENIDRFIKCLEKSVSKK